MLIVFVAFKDEIYQSDLVLRVVVGFYTPFVVGI